MTLFEELQRRGLLAQLTDEEEIKELIKDDDLSSVKLGVRVQQLQRFINKFGELRYRRELNERHK